MRGAKKGKRTRPGGETRRGAPAAAPAWLRHPYLALAARLLLAGIFAVSAAGKFMQPDAFLRAVAGYEVLPEFALAPFAALFPWLELAVAVLLGSGLFLRQAATVAGALLLVFIALMGTAFLQGKAVDCGCFVGILQETVGPTTLIRDGLMLLLLVPLFFASSHRWSLDDRLRRRGTVGRELALAVASVAVTVALGQAFFFAQSALASNSAAPERPTTGWRLGPEAAPVEIVVFSDFQCPACQTVAPVLKRLVTEYDGRVSLVYRHFPLPQHEYAAGDAEAAEAAGEQGRFWETHDAILVRRGELTRAELRRLAGQIGLDLARFDAALASGRPRAAVEADYAEGLRRGVSYTPYVTVSGEVVPSLSYQALKAAVERKLASQ